MANRTLYRMVILLLLAGMGYSCKDISSAPDLVVSAPDEHARYEVGDSIHVMATFDPAGTIQQYKIQLVLPAPYVYVDTTADMIAFGSDSYLYVSGLNYNQDHIDDTVQLATNFMPGHYYLIIAALNDNMSESKDTLDIFIRNPLDTIYPFMNITSPAEGFMLGQQDTLSVFALVNEFRSGMVQVRAQIQKVTLVESATEDEVSVLVNTTDPLIDTVQRKYVIPGNLAAGNYELRFFTLDEFNNDSTQVVHIVVQ